MAIFSCRNNYINYSCTHMLRGSGESGAYASSSETILKTWCGLVRFGAFGVCFDEILS